MHQVVKYDSNLIPPDDDPSKYSQADIQNRILGSKLVLVVEQMQILTIWIVKSCLLSMYNRMTLVLPQHKIVIGTSIYVATAFVRIALWRTVRWLLTFDYRLSWRYYISRYGVDRSVSIGLFPHTPVSVET
jgi:hypothetical protein